MDDTTLDWLGAKFTALADPGMTFAEYVVNETGDPWGPRWPRSAVNSIKHGLANVERAQREIRRMYVDALLDPNEFLRRLDERRRHPEPDDRPDPGCRLAGRRARSVWNPERRYR